VKFRIKEGSDVTKKVRIYTYKGNRYKKKQPALWCLI